MGSEREHPKIDQVDQEISDKEEKGADRTVELTKNSDDQALKERDVKDEADKDETEHFVLVHGFGHGAWCWYKIKTLMENSGYKVSCIDLKGSGIDQTDPNTIFDFDDYNKPLLDFLSDLPDHEQIILVGHSAGGLSLIDATHKYPNKIRLAVYVAATMLRNGFVSDQDVQDGIPDLSEFGEAMDFVFNLGTNQPPTSMAIKKQLLRKINYQMSPQEDSTLATLLVRPGPIRAFSNPIFNLNGGNEIDKVPRIYIKTTHDNALKLAKQEAMVKKWPPSSVYALESDHSPFFSAPFLLFGLLVKAVSSL